MAVDYKMTARAHYRVVWNVLIVGPVNVVWGGVFIRSHTDIIFHKQPVPTIHAGNDIGDPSFFHRILLHGFLFTSFITIKLTGGYEA